MLDDTIEELRSAALAADDAMGHFPAMYARVTDRIRTDVAAGRFADSTAMEVLACSFADWYLRPLAGRSPVPASWQATRDVAGDTRLLIVQHLLLGINAHVNHDLPQVVVATAEERGTLASIRPDFDTINDVLGDTMPDVLGDLARVSHWSTPSPPVAAASSSTSRSSAPATRRGARRRSCTRSTRGRAATSPPTSTGASVSSPT